MWEECDEIVKPVIKEQVPNLVESAETSSCSQADTGSLEGKLNL